MTKTKTSYTVFHWEKLCAGINDIEKNNYTVIIQ